MTDTTTMERQRPRFTRGHGAFGVFTHAQRVENGRKGGLAAKKKAKARINAADAAEGPYSRAYKDRACHLGYTKLDGRTKQGAYLMAVKKELLGYIGPSPTTIQSMLIDRAAVLSLGLAQIDYKILEEKPVTILDSNQMIAWHNALCRTLIALGLPKLTRLRKLQPSLESIVNGAPP